MFVLIEPSMPGLSCTIGSRRRHIDHTGQVGISQSLQSFAQVLVVCNVIRSRGSAVNAFSESD
jgi:hypothetical protein